VLTADRRGRQRLRGIERAGSVVLDAHKGLFLPFGTGCLLVRDADLLRHAHTGPEAEYLQDIQNTGLPDFADCGPELTRDYRGLRMWLPLHLHGVEAFRAALDEKLDLAEYAYRQLSDDPRPHCVRAARTVHCGLPVPAHESSRRRRPGYRGAVTPGQRRATVFLSSIRIDGRYTGRNCVLDHRTDHARVAEASRLSACTRRPSHRPAGDGDSQSCPPNWLSSNTDSSWASVPRLSPR
jgi:aromatic-L-amino-acid decarboxylase